MTTVAMATITVKYLEFQHILRVPQANANLSLPILPMYITLTILCVFRDFKNTHTISKSGIPSI